jgi:hypothetical protein
MRPLSSAIMDEYDGIEYTRLLVLFSVSERFDLLDLLR